MNDLPRPDHALSVSERLRRRIETIRDQTRLRLRRRQRVAPDKAVLHGAEADLTSGIPRPIASMIPGVIAGAVFVLLGIGGVWAWQSWSNRISEPIDDRLPMLLAAGELPVVAEEPVDAGGSTSLGLGTAAPDAPLHEPPAQAVGAGASDSQPPVPTAPAPAIIVHVAGAVTQAGVVELESGARVIDALQAAGGAAARADLDRVNLAAPVMDGERIHVPTIGEDAVPIVVSSSGQPTPGTAGQIDEPLMLDLNTSSAVELEELPGVGPSTAAAIVRTRQSRGPFRAVQELLEVPGIGEAKLSQIEPFVQVSG